jgi:type I restriction enzyme R subunit
VLQQVEQRQAYDTFDVLAEAAYGAPSRTRVERAETFKRGADGWLIALPVGPRTVVTALADQFAQGGTEELESRDVLKTPAVARAGGLAALSKLGDPRDVLRETRSRIFA